MHEDRALASHIVSLDGRRGSKLAAEASVTLVVVRHRGRHGRLRCVPHGTSGFEYTVPTTSAPLSLQLPGAVADYSADTALDLAVFRFRPGYLDDVAREAYADAHGIVGSVYALPHRLLTRRLNEYLDRLSDPVDPPSTLEMNARAVLVATKVIRDFSSSRTGPSRQDGGLPAWRVRQIQAYVESHLARAVSLNELAALAGLSRFHFCRAFKTSTGVSPIRWIQSKRMQVAEELVVGTTDPLIDIAMQLGYHSVAHFSRVFHGHHGVRPSLLRRTN